MVLYFVCYALSRVCGIIYNYGVLLRYIISYILLWYFILCVMPYIVYVVLYIIIVYY